MPRKRIALTMRKDGGAAGESHQSRGTGGQRPGGPGNGGPKGAPRNGPAPKGSGPKGGAPRKGGSSGEGGNNAMAAALAAALNKKK